MNVNNSQQGVVVEVRRGKQKLYPMRFNTVDGMSLQYLFTKGELGKFNRVMMNINVMAFCGILSECQVGPMIGCITTLQIGVIPQMFLIPKRVLNSAVMRNAKMSIDGLVQTPIYMWPN